jgi:hypothetical protein
MTGPGEPVGMKRSAWIPGALLLLAACQSGGKTAGVERTDGFPAPDREIVFDVAARTLRQQGFAIDVENSSPETGVITTRWSTQLAPFSGQGQRDKATVYVRDVPGHPNYYVVEANVVREINNEIVQPGNPIKAEWGNAKRVPEFERILVRQVESYFLTSRVSPELRQKYNLQNTDRRLVDPELPDVPKAPETPPVR